MNMREQRVDPRIADQLDRELELIRTGTSPDLIGRGFNTAYAAAALHAIDARDVEPDPSAEFVRLLMERLMKTASTANIGADRSQMRASTVHHPAGNDIPAWIRDVVSLRVAAAFVLMVAATLAFAGLRGQGDGDDNRPMLQAASQPEATALAATSSVPLIQEAVDIAECNATARTPTTVAGLVGTTPTSTAFLPSQPAPEEDRVVDLSPSQVEFQTSGLPAASQEEYEGVTETLRQLSACRFTLINPFSLREDFHPYDDYDGTYYSLFSDDFFRRRLTHTVGNVDLPVMGTSWIPVGPLPPALEELRQIDDGRLVAVIQSAYRTRWSAGSLVVFTWSGSRWLVDEYVGITPEIVQRRAEGQAATPAADEYWSQYLEVSLRDDSGSTWDAPTTSGKYRANQDIFVTLANIGKLPHHFEIPDLEIQITVPPGHSVSFVLNASEGAYTYRSFTRPAGTAEIQCLDGVFEFIPEGEAIPMG